MDGIVNVTNFQEEIRDEVALSLIVGILYLATSSLCMIIYSIVLVIFHHDADFNMLSTYRIMFQMGIFDCIQLAVHCCSAIFVIASVFELNIENAVLLNKIFGAIINACWYPVNFASFCLAVDRFLRLLLDHCYETLFSSRKIMWYIIAYWTIYAAMLILCLSPWCSFLFDTVSFTWYYSDKESISINEHMEWMDHMVVLALIVLEAILYGAMIKQLISKFGVYSKWRKEKNLTVQLICVYTFEVLTIIQWQIIEPHFTVFESNAYLAFSNYLWIIWNGIRPFLYVSLNRKLRRKLLLILLRLLLKKSDSTSIGTGERHFNHHHQHHLHHHHQKPKLQHIPIVSITRVVAIGSKNRTVARNF